MNRLISIAQLTRKETDKLINSANSFRNKKILNNASNQRVIGLIFLQESTRTRLGFAAAAYKLGVQVLELFQTKFDSKMTKAEDIKDTIRVVSGYSDLVIVRSGDSGIFVKVLPLVNKPVINAGNGDDEHPTQALIDLMAIQNNFNRIGGLKIALVGDLRFMRATHSLVLGLAKFEDISVTAVSPKELKLPRQYKEPYLKSGNRLVETEQMFLSEADVVYVSGFSPKTPIGTFSNKIRMKFQINKEITKKLKNNSIILCPLPRIDEITIDVDSTAHAKYFQQSDLGLFMRMAILEKYL